ncbi:hypothetical protein IWX90DRAFT_315016 [Phyllosticta citrichinensis]|uniref:Uncharacterized protein n=1 Tax=Phyllosticta citrichinensis TaxID=1130410 RepID=A0ABR1XJ57_9PEZI
MVVRLKEQREAPGEKSRWQNWPVRLQVLKKAGACGTWTKTVLRPLPSTLAKMLDRARQGSHVESSPARSSMNKLRKEISEEHESDRQTNIPAGERKERMIKFSVVIPTPALAHGRYSNPNASRYLNETPQGECQKKSNSLGLAAAMNDCFLSVAMAVHECSLCAAVAVNECSSNAAVAAIECSLDAPISFLSTPTAVSLSQGRQDIK